MQPLLIPTDAWQDISLDFIERLPTSQHKNAILVVVDRLTKYGHFTALSHPYTVVSVVNLFIQNIFRLHGMPRSIASDRDPTSVSQFWNAFFKSQGSSFCRSFAYHPQSDGQTEELNRVLEHYLRCFVGDKPPS